MAKISQREARKLRKRVCDLEEMERKRRTTWNSQWPNGAQITSAKWDQHAAIPTAIRTARKLSHAVVAIAEEDGNVRFIALPHPKDAI